MLGSLFAAFLTDKPHRKVRVPALLAPFAFFAALPLHAHDLSEPLYDIVSLSAEADTEIDNDVMLATLVVQAEAATSDALADAINTDMSWALEALEAHPGIERETRDYSTWPRYDTSQTRRLIGWRGSQNLTLESDDFAAMGEAIQTLQERLQVRDTTLAVSHAARRAASDALIDEALDAFERRAERVRRNLGAAGYRILEVDIRTEGQAFAPEVMMRAQMMEASASQIAEPGIAGGTSRLSVFASGRIRLERTEEDGDR